MSGLTPNEKLMWQSIYQSLAYPTFQDRLRIPPPVQRLTMPAKVEWILSQRVIQRQLVLPRDPSPFDPVSTRHVRYVQRTDLFFFPQAAVICYLCSSEDSIFALENDETKIKKHLCSQQHAARMVRMLNLDSATLVADKYVCELCWRG